MKESIGNAFVFGAFILFAFLTIIILTSAISYSRASKIKNRLVNYIELYAENKTKKNGDEDIFNDSDFQTDINTMLSNVGYRQTGERNCKDLRDDNIKLMDISSSSYDYCIYRYKTDRGYYYRVITYMYFDLPIIGNTLKFPISGSTRVIYNLGEK